VKILIQVLNFKHFLNFKSDVPAHAVNIEKAITKAIEDAGLKSLSDIDAVAVTRGPGLEICLRVG
jgi:tRNA A37 threonylcarbamoyltransferase TsaD